MHKGDSKLIHNDDKWKFAHVHTKSCIVVLSIVLFMCYPMATALIVCVQHCLIDFKAELEVPGVCTVQ